MSKNNLNNLVLIAYGIFFSSFLILCTIEISQGNFELKETLLVFPLYIFYALVCALVLLIIDYITDNGIFNDYA